MHGRMAHQNIVMVGLIIGTVFALFCSLATAEREDSPHSGLLRWTCLVETDVEMARNPGLHSVWASEDADEADDEGEEKGLGLEAFAWTVCNSNVGETDCNACSEAALKHVRLSFDRFAMLDSGNCGLGDGVQVFFQNCKLRYSRHRKPLPVPSLVLGM